MSKIFLKKATQKELGWIVDAIDRCRPVMASHQSGQWQGNEPSKTTILQDILNGTYYLLSIDEVTVGGCASLNNEPAYNHLISGSWLNQNPYRVLHRFFIDPSHHQKGYGAMLLRATEQWVLAQGIHNIRLDTHARNEPMKKLLLKAGYPCCGEVNLPQAGLRLVYHKVIGEI
jgi:RimJ/RimL family protein N-acetyltransferase